MENKEIKAIETVYNGYRFRSRLEARWAVFFDALGIPYEYEKEGFVLPSGRYLPDFYLPEHRCWIEIKPKGVYDKDSMLLCEELASASVLSVYYCNTGICPELQDDAHSYSPAELMGAESWMFWRSSDDGHVIGDNLYVWCECPECGSLGIQFDGRSGRNAHKESCIYYGNDGSGAYKNYNWYSPRIAEAYRKARQARFEFGENEGS